MSFLYYYTARSAQGAFLRGSIEANSQTSALAALRTRALFVTSLSRAGTAAGALAAALHGGPLSRGRLVPLFRALATLVSAGVPMRRAIRVLCAQCPNGRLAEALESIGSAIEGGHSLSQAFAQHPKEFPPLYAAMIAAGEAGGTLEDVLERLATLLERENAVRKRLTASLAYPAVVACAAVALLVFLLVSIVPMFESLYAQMRVPLPRTTMALIGAANAVHSPWFLAIGIAASVIAAVSVYSIWATPQGAAAYETLAWRAPFTGAIVRKVHGARFARTFGSLLRSGLPVSAALDSVASVISFPLQACVAAVRESLAAGSPLHEPLEQSRVFDPLFVQMIRVGEETGCIDAMFLRVADYYEADVETALSALGSLLEPAMMLLLGGAVAFIVSSIFIPLYSLIGNMK